MAKLLLGKDVAASIDAETLLKADALIQNGVSPKLAILRIGANPSDISYENGAVRRAEKCHVTVEKIAFPDDVSKETVCAEIDRLNGDSSVHGILLFRPLPKPLRAFENELCNRIRIEKDVDCAADLSNAYVYLDKKGGFAPCTAEACLALADFYGVDFSGKNVAVIGRSTVIGKPVAMLLLGRDRNATVTVCHTKTANLPEITRRADIIISAAGHLELIRKDFVRPGQTLIDVSVNWDETKNAFAGDAVFDDVEPVVDALTPVPRGVGAVTTSILMRHVVQGAEKSI